jgi:hypothetical protein
MAGASNAMMVDATVLLSKAANSRTLTVKYTEAAAAMAELRINGVSTATRSLDQKNESGETTFDLNMAALKDGENEIEVKLYDEDGNVIGSQKTTVSVDRSSQGPVYLEKPRNGETVRGHVSLNLGLTANLKSVYVSFFVDDEMQALKNYPPYSYVWDTKRMKNGWHEVQAWVVDDLNNTFKTEKLRLFVDNQGGWTKREAEAGPTSNSTTAKPGTLKGTKPLTSAGGNSAVTEVKPAAKPAAPVEPIKETINDLQVSTAGAVGTKSVTIQDGTATSYETLQPESLEASPQLVARNFKPAALGNPAAAPVAITFGTRLPNAGPFEIKLNDEIVAFDVQPRVTDGIPLTPFRHLFEHAGGEVKWTHETKEVEADGLGRSVWFKVGSEFGKVDGMQIRFESKPFIESSRIIVPLSFLVDSLDVRVDYDSATGHVLVSSDTAAK